MGYFFKGGSFIRIAIIMIVMVFMAGQVTVTKAGGRDWGTWGGGFYSGRNDCPDCPDAWDKILTDDRFELVMGGEAVRDNETCLVWEQSPDSDPRNWSDAIDHCYKSEVGGRGGWRLPTIEELGSLKDTVNTNPALPSGHPFDTDAVKSTVYWSSTTKALNTSFAWNVIFNDGTVHAFSKQSDSFVWCVRSGQGHDAPIAAIPPS